MLNPSKVIGHLVPKLGESLGALISLIYAKAKVGTKRYNSGYSAEGRLTPNSLTKGGVSARMLCLVERLIRSVGEIMRGFILVAGECGDANA